MMTFATRLRHLLQFSLKTLLLLMLIAGVACGWFKWKLVHKQREREAVAAIRRAGGSAYYDYELLCESAPYGPEWLRQALGDDFFSSVACVSLSSDPVTAEWLVHLEPLTELTDIYASGSGIGDDGVRYFAKFKKLSQLNLDRTVTDAGLTHLKELAPLKRLVLSSAKGVTDAGLIHVRGLTDLEVLWLDGTSVTGTGLAHLQGLRKLRQLNLRDTPISDAGVAHLKELTSLEQLWLEGWGIDDNGLEYLSHLSNLTELHMYNTIVTDCGLRHLRKLSKLKQLGTCNSLVTDAGIAEFQKAMPKCEIFR